MRTRAQWIVAALIAAACGSSDEDSGRDGTSGSGGSGGSGAVAGTFAPGPSGGQLTRCSSDDDCTGGLECYTFGRYCSASCATDTDCATMGASFTCYVAAGFGMMGGSGSGAGGAGGTGTTGGARGTCRLECQGASDTSSCPTGLMCIDVSIGMAEPAWRCAYPSSSGGSAGTSGGSGSGSAGTSGGSGSGSAGTSGMSGGSGTGGMPGGGSGGM